jgi:CubicO group peptidase (beta-lactamase class C family)
VVPADKPVHSRASGCATPGPGDPVTDKTVFQLASVSEPLGASVVVAAVGMGGLKSNDPITKHLPGFEVADKYVTRNVTVADMHSHR